MIASGVPIHKFSVPKPSTADIHGKFSSNKSNPWWGQKWDEIRCCRKRVGAKATSKKNYYELLGVSADSNMQEIKEAYRRLQKKYHPDIAGQQGHEYTLMLNEAYEVLIKDNLRRDYDASIGPMNVQFGRNVSGYSSWKGPLRPQALFVDANACIGCRECVHHASNTFVMDEAHGCARVRVQYGDNDQKINVSVDSCPVNCIHWVDREELAVLEFLIQPRPKEGYGVFGGGWERPANVFMAAKAFKKQLKQQAEAQGQQRNGRVTVEEETPAQAEARANATMKIKMERFSITWNNLKPFLAQIFGIGSDRNM